MDYNAAIEALKEVERHGFKAIIAGGWLRDRLNGVEAKDLDIFVLGVHNREDFPFSQQSYVALYDDMRYFGRYDDSVMREDVLGVLKYKSKMIDHVLMKTYTAREVIYNFDVSVCQIWAELEGDRLKVYATQDYMDYVNYGIIYVYTNIPTCESHLERVRLKYNTELIPSTFNNSPIVDMGYLDE